MTLPDAEARVKPVSVDIDQVERDLEAASVEGRRPILLRRIEIGDDALSTLPRLVGELRGPGPVVLLMDRTPMTRAGADLKLRACELLAPFEVDAVVLGEPGEELHADREALDQAAAAIEGAGCVVGLGSGTVCDIGKDATHRNGDVPYIVVQTACSVNAFSDDMAVVLHHGVKRTLPSRWPTALVVDLQVIADAPAALNRSGVAELLAMFTAPADWQLAETLGMDAGYDAVVVELFRGGGDRLLELGRGIARNDRAALADLCALMTLSGIALGIAGRTAPISGGEHTISHLLDMAAAATGRPGGLHGAQVGVAAVIESILWRRVLSSLDPARLLDEPPTDEASRSRVDAAFSSLDPTGEMAAECWRDYGRKLGRWRAKGDRRAEVAGNWPEIASRLRALVADPAAIVGTLREAGAPTRFSELTPALDASTARWAVANAHLMRDRFTVLDLAAFTSGWDAAAVDDVLEDAAALGGGL
jgi:glycerol-1-phosphate dehydrogenase [NAD(P)+]